MKYQFIKAHYNRDKTITVHARDIHNKKTTITVRGFEPYFYIPIGERIYGRGVKKIERKKRESFFGDTVKKVVAENPAVVPNLRDKVSKVYEAYIPFIRRFMIDTEIRSGFVCEGKDVHHTELKPVETTITPEIMYTDIEIVDGEMVLITFNINGRYITLVVGDHSVDTHDKWDIIRVNDERELVEKSSKVLGKLKPDVLVAWYAEFDVGKYKDRCKKYNIDPNLEGTLPFDIMKGYEKVFDPPSKSLSYVVKSEFGYDKVEFTPSLWGEHKNKAIRANKDHVRYMVEIDDSCGITPYFWELRNAVGMEDFDTIFFNSKLVDVLLLREVGDDVAMPSSSPYSSGTSEPKFTGATVLQPEPGIYRDIAYMDFAKFYPNIVIGYNISPEYVGMNQIERINADKGYLPRVCEKLIEERMKYERRMDKALRTYGEKSKEYQIAKRKRNSIKFLLNSVWGFIGYDGSRVYRKEMAAEVTKHAREGIKVLEETAENMGFEAVAGDTDSIMIEVGTIENGKKVGEELNKALAEFCEEEGIPPRLKVEFEHLYDRIAFKKKRGERKGAKKKYAGRVTWENGEEVDYIEFTGMSLVRRDSSQLTKEVQREVFNKILREGKTDEVIEYLREVVTDMKQGEYPVSKIAIPVTMDKSFSEYKSKPAFVRGAEYGDRYLGYNMGEGDYIKKVYVKGVKGKPSTDVVSFPSGAGVPDSIRVDWNKMIEKTIKNKVKNTLKLIGYSWSDVYSKSDLDGVFG